MDNNENSNINNDSEIQANTELNSNVNNELNNIELNNVVNEPVINETESVNPTPDLPVNNETNPNTETKKNNKPLLFIIIGVLVVVIACVVIFVIKPFSKENGDSDSNDGKISCVENIKNEGYMSSGDQLGMASGDTQYVFGPKFDTNFIMKAVSFDEIVLNICSSDKNTSSFDFNLGETTKTRVVDSFELVDKNTNKKLEAKDIDTLLTELGYHTYGKHSEEAKLVSKSDSPEFGIDGDKSYIYYKLEIAFSNGKVIEANYKVEDKNNDKSAMLKENENYTFDFEVSEGMFGSVEYTVTSFK